MRRKPMTKAELARYLGVSRTHITLLTQGKRKLSEKLADKLADLLAGKANALSMTSNPLGGVRSVFGGFDSHTLPPDLSAYRFKLKPQDNPVLIDSAEIYSSCYILG